MKLEGTWKEFFINCLQNGSKLFILVCMTTPVVAQDDYVKRIKEYRESIKTEHIAEARAPLTGKDFEKVYYFKANKKYKVFARYIPFQTQDTVSIPTSSGKMKKFIRAGKMEGQLHSNTFQLTAFLSTNGMDSTQDFFIPFKDRTNGKKSYAGGRFLEVPVSSVKEGVIEIDFNKAYNPWCAYSDGFNCPIPPKENEMAISIKAGEKNYKGEKKKGSKKLQ